MCEFQLEDLQKETRCRRAAVLSGLYFSIRAADRWRLYMRRGGIRRSTNDQMAGRRQAARNILLAAVVARSNSKGMSVSPSYIHCLGV